MIQPGNSLGNSCHGGTLRIARPFEHEHGNSQFPGRSDFTVGGSSAAVLGDDSVDGERLEYQLVFSLGKRSPRVNIVYTWDIERRLDAIYTPDYVVVLRRRTEGPQFLAPNGEKDPAGSPSKRPNRILRVNHINPLIALNRQPRWPSYRKNRRVRMGSSRDGVCGNRLGIGMCCIDQNVDLLGAQILGQPCGTPKTATTRRRGLRSRFCSPACQRDSHLHGTCLEGKRDLASFSRSAKNQDAGCHG